MLMIAQGGLSALPLSLFVCLTLFSSSTSAFDRHRSSAQGSREVAMERLGGHDSPSPSKWAPPTFYSDLSSFNVTHFSTGKHNLEVVAGVTPDAENAVADDLSTWTRASSIIQIFYPEGSVNPKSKPQGGTQFYAAPLDLRHARSVTFAYSVFFPSDFEWVKGGKLPGLYGGRTGCSGGDAADDCFSTRMMWRKAGAGELYLYAPKGRQTLSLCNTPPLSVCDQAYGLSIGRGSFHFAAGSWTRLRQTVTLNTPGHQDGGFRLKVDGRVVLDLTDVFYRDVQGTPPDDDGGSGLLGPILARKRSSGASTRKIEAKASTAKKFVKRRAEQHAEIAHDDDEPIGFKGIFFSTFFGGHDKDWATPKDQYVWFKDFELHIHDLE